MYKVINSVIIQWFSVFNSDFTVHHVFQMAKNYLVFEFW